MIGCIVLLVLGIIGAIAMYFGARYLVSYGSAKVISMLEEEVMQIPEDMPGREELREALASAVKGVKTGDTSPEELASLVTLASQVKADNKIDEAEVKILTDYLRKASSSKDVIQPPEIKSDPESTSEEPNSENQ